MAPRISLFATRSVAFRTKPVVPQKRFAPLPQSRFVSDDAPGDLVQQPPPGKGEQEGDALGADQSQNLHVSEEQAAMDKITGDTPPDLERGTPLPEVRQSYCSSKESNVGCRRW